MQAIQEQINLLESLIDRVNALNEVTESLWYQSIAEKKWSIAQILAHISAWDEVLIMELLPSLISQRAIQFPDTEMINAEAGKYGERCNKQELYQQVVHTRAKIVNTLRSLPEEVQKATFSINNYDVDPKTGQPFTFLFLLSDFTSHDEHHLQQIESFILQHHGQQGS